MTLLRGLVSLDQRISAGSLLILPPHSSERQSSPDLKPSNGSSGPQTSPTAHLPPLRIHLDSRTNNRVPSRRLSNRPDVQRRRGSSAVSTLRPDRPVLRSAVSAPSCPRQNYLTRNCSALLAQPASQAAHHITVRPDQLNPNRLTALRTKKNLGAKTIDNRHIFLQEDQSVTRALDIIQYIPAI